jgi:DNA-binding beta-propeller fold protein YncE
MFLGGLSAEAVLLPHQMSVYLFDNARDCTVRFDGLINFQDGTVYLPVIPEKVQDVSKLEIVWTYPANKTLKDKPEIVLFNNGYSLFKVINVGKKKTLTSYTGIPAIIRQGIFPQDMLVPNGLYVSETYRGMLGNLEIPVVDNSMTANAEVETKQVQQMDKNQVVVAQKNGKKLVKTHIKAVKTQVPKELKNKMFLITNFDSQYLKVFIPGRPEPVYGLKLKGILKDVKVTPDKKYLIAAIFGKQQVDIADIENEQIARSIEIGMQPSEIEVNKDANKTYVLSSDGRAIFAIDLSDMMITEKISLDAVPYKMALSEDGNQLAYADKNTDSIFIIKVDDEYKNIPITTMKNISKLIVDDSNRIYAVSRTQNKLLINDYDLNKNINAGEEDDTKNAILQRKLAEGTKKFLGVPTNVENDKESTEGIEPITATVDERIIQTGQKPTDIFLYGNKLFVLCSGDKEIQVLDTDSLKYSSTIKVGGEFPRKITRIDNSNLAMVTDANAKKYTIINLDTSKIVGVYPMDMPVQSVTIVNKINNINLLEQTL